MFKFGEVILRSKNKSSLYSILVLIMLIGVISLINMCDRMKHEESVNNQRILLEELTSIRTTYEEKENNK